MSKKYLIPLNTYIHKLSSWQKKEVQQLIGVTQEYLYQCVCGPNRPKELIRRAVIKYSKENPIKKCHLTEHSILFGYIEMDKRQGKDTKRLREFNKSGNVINERNEVIEG